MKNFQLKVVHSQDYLHNFSFHIGGLSRETDAERCCRENNVSEECLTICSPVSSKSKKQRKINPLPTKNFKGCSLESKKIKACFQGINFKSSNDLFK